jgi:hypothetical protein
LPWAGIENLFLDSGRKLLAYPEMMNDHGYTFDVVIEKDIADQRERQMRKANCGAVERTILCRTVAALFLLGTAVASVQAQTLPGQQAVAPAAKGYVYWTNSLNGSLGRTSTTGSKAKEKFIVTKVPGGAGLTVDKHYIYWTGANGGSATTIARATLKGADVNLDFITGAQNPCGVAVDKTNIYWAGDIGSTIGRANLDGSDVNLDFIATGTGVCGVAVTKKYIYWANYQTAEIGRAKRDGSDVNLDFISGCGSGIAIEGKFIYFTTASGTGLARANIDGTGVNPNFIAGLNGQIAFLAVDKTAIFWADWGNRGTGKTIGRANLDGSDVNQSFVTGTKGGFGIAVTGGDP